MRHGRVNDRFSRGPRLPRWVRWVALVATAGWATLSHAQPIDLAPLLQVETDPSRGLSAGFSDYDALVIGGIQQWNGQPRTDGVVDLVKQTYDSELDGAHRWFVDATVTLFDSAAHAARDIDSSCYPYARGGAAGGGVRARKGVYCVSPVTLMRTDPQNLYLPAKVYSSWVFVRRDRIVVRLYERHKGSKESAKNPIIVDVANRLSKLNASPQPASEFKE
jgi:hypothetical protein